MGILPNRKQWKTWALPSKLSFLGSFASVLGLILAIASLVFQPRPSTDIDSKIKELDNIKGALTTLNDYVGNQQKALKDISSEKSSLENERHRIQTALQIDKEKLDTLLEYQLAQQRSGAWIEWIISFFVGVLSSSVVTFAAIRIQSRKPKIDSQPEQT
jgi:hypothetical protein